MYTNTGQNLIYQIPDIYLICTRYVYEICLSLSVSSIISASSDRRRMQRSLLEPPHRAASNGGDFIPLRPLDAEIFNETSTIQHYITTPFAVSLNISASSGRRGMKSPPFDAARQGGSNKLRCILLRLLETEIIDEMLNERQISYTYRVEVR